MTCRISAGLILLLMLFAYPAMQARAFENARELTNACRKVDQEVAGKGKQIRIPRTKDALLCWGYMQGLQDIVTLADEAGRPIMGSCPPEYTTTLDLLRSFLGYGRSHPEALKSTAAVAVILALQSTYPCSEAEAHPDTTGADIQPVQSTGGLR
jgi:Rap1a immunity proteins